MLGHEGKRPPNTFFRWLDEDGMGANDDDGDGLPRNSNVYEFNKVTKFKKHAGTEENQVLNRHQKSLALCENLVYTYAPTGEWALELCAGSGSFTCAALRASMNVVAVDNDKRQVTGLKERIISCLQENPNDECAIAEEEAGEKEEREEGEEVEEGEEGDED